MHSALTRRMLDNLVGIDRGILATDMERKHLFKLAFCNCSGCQAEWSLVTCRTHMFNEKCVLDTVAPTRGRGQGSSCDVEVHDLGTSQTFFNSIESRT